MQYLAILCLLSEHHKNSGAVFLQQQQTTQTSSVSFVHPAPLPLLQQGGTTHPLLRLPWGPSACPHATPILHGTEGPFVQTHSVCISPVGLVSWYAELGQDDVSFFLLQPRACSRVI